MGLLPTHCGPMDPLAPVAGAYGYTTGTAYACTKQVRRRWPISEISPQFACCAQAETGGRKNTM